MLHEAAQSIESLGGLLRRRASERGVADALLEANDSTQDGAQSIRRVSYQRLLTLAEGVASELAGRGVQAGDRVMIVAENSIAQITAFFATTLLEAWPVLINARMTAREIDVIRDHCDPRVVLYVVSQSPGARAHAARDGAALVDVELDAEYAWGPVRTAATAELGSEANKVAALIYTSGTTGAPKGVMVTHRGLLHFAERSCAVRRQTAEDVVFGALPMAHIFGVATILLTTVWAGGSIFLMPRFDPARADAALRSGLVSILHGVPSLYSRLIGWLRETGREAHWPRLRYVYVGGGALDPALKARIERALDLPAHHGYGMTEYAGSMFVTHVDHPRADALPGTISPDCEVRFVDGEGGDVTAGQPGEIWIRGPGTMLGYYRAPELTNEVLSKDGWLHTGDVGYLQPDGALRIVGRQRDVIKCAGFLVYPAEVELELLHLPGVRMAAVIGLPNSHGDEDIVALVELDPGARFDAAAALRALRTRLAGYKLPRRIEIVDALPLTLNGKVRKQELRRHWRERG